MRFLLATVILLFVLSPGFVWRQAENSKCLDLSVALKSAEKTGLTPFDLDRDSDLEQLLINAQLSRIDSKDRIGAPVEYYCVYDTRNGGFRVLGGRVSALVWSSESNPSYFVCDSSCEQTFVISDTDQGRRNLRLLFQSLLKPPITSKEAEELASLAAMLLKRWHPDAKRASVKEKRELFEILLRSGRKQLRFSIDRLNLSVAESH